MADQSKCNCEIFREQLYFLLDGQCSPQLSCDLKEHLQQCPECAAEFGSAELIRTMLRRCCQQSAPETLHSTIHTRITTRVTQIRRGF